MKYNLINKCAKISAFVVVASMIASCTGKFEEYNTNPYGPTQEDMIGDNASTGSLIRSMIPALAQGQQNNSQMLDQMIGSEFGGQITCIATWGNGGNYYTYNPRIGWYGNMFDTTMPQIYTGFFQIRKLSEGRGLAYQWAQILRVAASMRISDCYGAIPYSQITGSAFTTAYDSMEDLYKNMFNDLDAAIMAFETAVLAGDDMSSLKEYDLVFDGDFRKWVKFANTLKLRMAIRISNAAPELAKQKAEEAVADVIGVMTDASDAAYSSYNDGMNPYYRVAYAWNEIRVSANITSYLGGYNDPRLSVYVDNASLDGGGYVGVRNGIYQSPATQASYSEFSRLKLKESDKLLIMSASEAYFLRAEGALKNWNMNGNAKEFYEKGVTVSMEERGVSVGNYLSDSYSTPADYVDPTDSGKNRAAVSKITPAYDESAGNAANLERILVQKWIANFPNGWETWADIRRTGYPKHFPIVNNLNTDGVTIERGMRRLPYPQSEYNTNRANVEAAVSMLGGADNSATDLWWAKKN